MPQSGEERTFLGIGEFDFLGVHKRMEEMNMDGAAH